MYINLKLSNPKKKKKRKEKCIEKKSKCTVD